MTASPRQTDCQSLDPQLRKPQVIRNLYQQLDNQINQEIGVDVGYTLLIAARPYPMKTETLQGFHDRYALIKQFQNSVVSLFKASLNGEEDPGVAFTVTGELPDNLGLSYHRTLSELQFRTPVFFRTDEVASGLLSEIQCSGSGWGLAEQLRELYCQNENVFGPVRHFHESLAAGFAKSLRDYLGDTPRIHHLVDNASRPHGIRYFIQRTRKQGLKYFSYDREISPGDCNFVRSHDFFSLAHHNFFVHRLQACNEKKICFDLPPAVLFDGKIIMAWPFWKKTRHWFSDEVRAIFPHTSIIEPHGIVLENDELVSIDDFCKIPPRNRNFYIKYGGSDISLNWGSKSVFNAASLSGVKCRELMDRIIRDYQRNRYWIIQRGFLEKEATSVLGREGESMEVEVYSKYSGFYGPAGLMALWILQKNSHKVHGSPDTIASIVH